jgi:hypothetical protein
MADLHQPVTELGNMISVCFVGTNRRAGSKGRRRQVRIPVDGVNGSVAR